MVQCNFARQCLERISEKIWELEENSFLQWFRTVGEQEREKLDQIAVVCWKVWKARNEKVWRRKDGNVSEVVATATDFLEQWQSAQCRDSCATLPLFKAGDGARTWTKPQVGQIKINVDAAVFEDDDSYGTGMVARDQRGELIEARTKLHVGRVEAELAELIGIREALSWIKEKGWEKVVVESDSLVCVSAIRNPCVMASPFGLIAQDCRNIICNLVDVSLFFIYRSANEVAHSFAKASRSFPERFVSGRDVPVDLLTRILDESQ